MAFSFQEIRQDERQGRHHRSGMSDAQILFGLEKTWQHMVFVRKTAADCEAVRDTLLELQGGQTKIACKKHVHPLVSAPRLKSSTRACSLHGCRRKIVFDVLVTNA